MCTAILYPPDLLLRRRIQELQDGCRHFTQMLIIIISNPKQGQLETRSMLMNNTIRMPTSVTHMYILLFFTSVDKYL